MRRLVRGLAVLAFVGAPLASFAQPTGPTYLHARIEAEVITPVIADFLAEGVRRAAREDHDAFLVELDTPGGLDASMREIVQASSARRARSSSTCLPARARPRPGRSSG